MSRRTNASLDAGGWHEVVITRFQLGKAPGKWTAPHIEASQGSEDLANKECRGFGEFARRLLQGPTGSEEPEMASFWPGNSLHGSKSKELPDRTQSTDSSEGLK